MIFQCDAFESIWGITFCQITALRPTGGRIQQHVRERYTSTQDGISTNKTRILACESLSISMVQVSVNPFGWKMFDVVISFGYVRCGVILTGNSFDEQARGADVLTNLFNSCHVPLYKGAGLFQNHLFKRRWNKKPTRGKETYHWFPQREYFHSVWLTYIFDFYIYFPREGVGIGKPQFYHPAKQVPSWGASRSNEWFVGL